MKAIEYGLTETINLQGDQGRTALFEIWTPGAGIVLSYALVTVPKGIYSMPSLYVAVTKAFRDISWVTVTAAASYAPYMFWNENENKCSISFLGTTAYAVRITPQSEPNFDYTADYNRPSVWPCHWLNALGFSNLYAGETILFPVSVNNGTTSVTSVTADSSPMVFYHPLHRQCNGNRLYCYEPDRFWTDQGDDPGQTQAVVMMEDAILDATTGLKGNYFARYDTVESTYLSLLDDPLAIRSQTGYVGGTLEDGAPSIKQVYAPRYIKTNTGNRAPGRVGPFEALLYPLLSTGTSGYNGAYDRCPLEISWGLQESLCDIDSFIAADNEIISEPTAQRWDNRKGFYYKDSPFSIMEMIQAECKLYGYALVRDRDEVLKIKNIRLPPVESATVTLDGGNSANESEKKQADSPLETVVNRWETKIVFNPYTGDFGRDINITDQDSKAGLRGLTRSIQIEHSGLPTVGSMEHPDYELVRRGLESLLIAASGNHMRYPSMIKTKTLTPELERQVYVGDVVTYVDSYTPDPNGTGSNSIDVPAIVTKKNWNHRTRTGNVELMLLAQYVNYPNPWAAAAVVDKEASNGGWDSVNLDLTLRTKHFTDPNLTSHDGERFAADDVVDIHERAPSDPNSPQSWYGIAVVSYTAGTKKLRLAPGAALTGWDSDKEYVVVVSSYGNTVASQKTNETFQADDDSYLLNGTASPYRFG